MRPLFPGSITTLPRQVPDSERSPSATLPRLLSMLRALPAEPAISVISVADLNLERLQALGIKAVMFDMDHTLLRKGEFYDGAIDKLRELNSRDISWVVLTSNPNLPLCQVVADHLSKELGGEQVLMVANALKPFSGGYRLALELLNSSPEQVLMVGDGMLPDIVGAERMGMPTALVGSPGSLSPFARFQRLLKDIKFLMLDAVITLGGVPSPVVLCSGRADPSPTH